MTQQLKRWESPRRKGRNDKGRGGAARQRQLQKRNQTLRQKLKDSSAKSNQSERGEGHSSPLLVCGDIPLTSTAFPCVVRYNLSPDTCSLNRHN